MKPVKQIFQSLKDGSTEILEIPCPVIKNQGYLIRTKKTLISAGTERMLVQFGKSGWIDKARSQPEKVKQVLNKIKTDGLLETWDAVSSKLDQPIPMGYCNVGIVEEAGKKCSSSLKSGDRVLSNGPHAELVYVPENLCVPVPDEVTDEEAVFTVLGAIGLQGIRLANPTIGESFVVVGLGIIGLLTVQLLKANGCRVLGMDFNQKRLEMAKTYGADILNLGVNHDALKTALAWTDGKGVDGVLITAATKSSDPVSLSAKISRKRGRIILVGVSGLELDRSDFYEKELSFQVSCSYGPGRYDPEYEQKGNDYPFGFVRWTEKRNFEAVLQLMKEKKLKVDGLISHTIPFIEAKKAYEMLSGENQDFLGLILDYPQEELEKSQTFSRILNLNSCPIDPARPVIGMIGAGNFSSRVLLPALTKNQAILKTIVSQNGISGTHAGKKFGFQNTSTDISHVFDDPEINTVMITTRHDTHASFIIKALEKGKHVFVEKPLCLNEQELSNISETLNNKKNLLMVGFNRRFSPYTKKIKDLLSTVNVPKTLIMTVNAGFIPKTHWIQDKNIGGGRLIGEGCHFIDLLYYITGEEIVSIQTSKVSANENSDSFTLTMTFQNGSVGTIHYFTNGHNAYPKERLEIFCSGKILQLNNFKELKGFGWKNFTRYSTWRQEKGHKEELKLFLDSIIEGRESPIPFEDIYKITQITLKETRYE